MSKTLECPLCESKILLLITTKVRFGNEADVYKCKDCALTFLDQNSFNFPDDFYEKKYHQTYLTHVEPDALNPQVYYEKMKKTTKIWADKFKKMLNGNEIVLDIGCSTGHFIDQVKDKTGEIFGYELNKNEVDFCRNVLGLDVSDQPLNERFDEGTFDYVIMIYVLEHIADPKQFLQSIKKYLKPTGNIIILVPNIQDALVNFYDIPKFRTFYYCIEHLFYYSPTTIKKLFDYIGFKCAIEVIQEYPITNHLNWAYRRAPSDSLASRKGFPDISLNDNTPIEAWIDLWNKFNQIYRTFLKENGYGDRIWCEVGLKA